MKNAPIFMLVISFLLLIGIYFNYHFSLLTFSHLKAIQSQFIVYSNIFVVFCFLGLSLYTFTLRSNYLEHLGKQSSSLQQIKIDEKIISQLCEDYYKIENDNFDGFIASPFCQRMKSLLDSQLFTDFLKKVELFYKNGENFSIVLDTKGKKQVEVKTYYFTNEGAKYLFLLKESSLQKALLRKSKSLDIYKELHKDWEDLVRVSPYPFWIENSKGDILWANAAYQNLGTTSDEMRINDLTKFVVSIKDLEANSKIVNINLHGTQKKFMFQGEKIKEDSALLKEFLGEELYFGFAQDVTEQLKYKQDLRRLVGGQTQIFESVNTGVAIYGPDTKLDFYNNAYKDLWQLSTEFLDSKPSYVEIIEDIRIRKRLPGHRNFQDFKSQRVQLFKSLTEDYEDMLYLPNGKVLHNRIVPHPYGGIIFIQEDVTKNLSMEGRYQTLQAVQKETLNSMAEGIAVFGSDGILKLYNPAYLGVFKCDDIASDDELHIQELSQKISMRLHEKNQDRQGELRQTLLNLALDRKAQSGTVKLPRGRIIRYSVVPLPDGANLNSFLDITDSVKAADNLKAKNEALKKMDQFKSEFITRASINLKTPLNSILGFSEILEGEYMGSLTIEQKDYIELIQEEGNRILDMVDNIIDMTALEAPRESIKRSNADLNDLFSEVRTYLNHPQSRKKVRVVFDVDQNLSKFPLDAEKFKRAFFSLFFQLSEHFEELNKITMLAALERKSMLITISASYKAGLIGDEQKENLTDDDGGGLNNHFSLAKNLVESHEGKFDLLILEKEIQIHMSFPYVEIES